MSYIPAYMGNVAKPAGMKPKPKQENKTTGSMQITVKTLSGKSIKLNVDPDTTIEMVKGLIEKQEGIAQENQRLIYAGKQIEDDDTLEDHGIRSGCMIHLVMRIGGRGGGYGWADTEAQDERGYDQESIQEIKDLQEMPIKAGWSGLWDIQVRVQGAGKIKRVASLNHPIKAQINTDGGSAIVKLRDTVDRSLVPCQDFVLLIRDEKIATTSVISSTTPAGQQALSVKLLPDMRSIAVKKRIENEIAERLQGMVDLNATVKYARTHAEQREYEQELKQDAGDMEDSDTEEEEVESDEEYKEEPETKKEFIFLLDRSGSMYQTIKIARQALILFLYSLPAGSYFNVCSYGSSHDFMFKGRSVPYNDKNLQEAIEKVKTFEANFGGTEIYRPLQEIFAFGKPRTCAETHIYLLTDGAVFNTNSVISLVQKNANLQQRVHTFGIGNGASEQLIKNCAFKGFGNYYFIYDEAKIQATVIKSLTRMQMKYSTLNSIRLFDKDGNSINSHLNSATAPIVDNNAVKLVDLIEAGQVAASYEIDILDAKTNKIVRQKGQI